ncbi:MAG: PAS domain S-box protein, partial [Candidatus Latescibacteria bacterium]|nr:PAS domain S-box protein [bacterium]MBD3423460.1 PAS domain S-box protein [Candidatus Latescibacterota bacterium]
EGKITGVVLVFRDITERYEKNRRIKETMDLLTATFNSIQDGVSVLNRDLTIRYINPVMEKWYGEKMPLVGQKCFICYQNREMPCEPCPTLRCMETGKAESDVVPGPSGPDSPVTWIELYSYPLKDSGTGEISGAVEFVRDITVRKSVQEELKRSRAILARTEKISHVGSWEWKIAGDQVTWSEELFRIFNIDPEEGAPSWADHRDLYNPDDMKLLASEVEKAVSEGTPYQMELRALPRGGGIKQCLARGFPVTGEDGKVERLYGSLQDITEMKKVEDQLKRSRENLRTTLNSIGDGVISTDTGGKVSRMNPIAEQLTGWKIDQARGRDLAEVFHIVNARSGERVENPVDKVLKEGKIVGLANHTRLISRDGNKYQIADSGSPIRNAEGDITGVVLVFRDVTESYRIREELRLSEERMNLAMSIKNEGIWDWDLLTNDVYFDRRYYEMAGYQANEFPSRLEEFQKRVHPEEIENVMGQAREHLEGRSDRFDVEFRFRKKDGEWMWIQGKGQIVERNEEGQPLRFVGTHSDITERKLAEKALHQSEERMDLALKGGDLGTWDWDVVTGELIYDDRLAEMLGYSKEEIAPELSGWEKLVHPDDLPGTWDAISRHLKGETDSYESEQRMLHKSGKWVWIMGRGRVIERDSSGKPLRACGTLHDINERRRAQEELARSAELLSSTLESTNNGILVVDNDGKVLATNEKFREMWRIPPEVISERQDGKLLGFVMEQLSDPGEFRRKVEELYTRPDKVSMDTVNFRDGRIFERYTQPLIINRGVEGRVWSFRDITDRENAERALRESEQRYRTLVSSMSDIIFLLDGDDRFRDVHCKPGNALFASPDDFMGRRINEVLPPDVSKLYDKASAELRSSGVTQRYEYPLTIGDRDMWFIANLDLHKDGESIIADIRDITERKNAQEALQRMQRLESVGTLAGGIAHDFNNILTGVYGNIELARMELPEDHRAYEHITTAHQSVERAKHLTKQLLTFAKGGEPLLDSVNVRQVIRDSVRFDLSGSRIKARLALPEDLWMIRADRGQISHVFANLIINAKEAMPVGGFIKISAENVSYPGGSAATHLSGDYVKITIRDEGVGIPENLIERVFDPYFTTKQTGSGLGLAIVHSIVGKHGGRVSVQSGQGEGTTFILFLPADKSVRDRKAAARPETAGKGKEGLGKVLVMDDQETVRDVTARMLDACGYKAELAESGEEALSRYISALESGDPFYAVIVDLTVPGGMGGRELTEQILEVDPDARIIVTSGYSTDPVLANYREYGFSGRLVKPFQTRDLMVEIERVGED